MEAEPRGDIWDGEIWTDPRDSNSSKQVLSENTHLPLALHTYYTVVNRTDQYLRVTLSHQSERMSQSDTRGTPSTEEKEIKYSSVPTLPQTLRHLLFSDPLPHGVARVLIALLS